MTTGLTYSQYVTQVAELAVVATDDTNFVAILPAMITYAENRIYRDLDLLSTVTAQTGYSLTASSPNLTFPQGTFVTVQDVNVITPVGIADPTFGTRNTLLPVSKSYLYYNYPNNSTTGVPKYFAMLSDYQMTVGPWPDQNYAVEIVGTIRPASLSATNTTTYISLYLPDLFIMASMVYISGYQRNFALSANQPNDAGMPVNYESQYMALLKSATVEEFRKKFQASGWTSMSPPVVATPAR
jgi:hypothetical protein